jgi:hypothetical protein
MPPGRYRLRAMVPGNASNPFARVLAIQRLECKVDVIEGADVVTQDVVVVR